MLKKKMMVLLHLCLLILLTGCTTYSKTAIEIRKIKPEVPSALLEDKELPAVPQNAKLQSEVSAYTKNLWLYATECKEDKKEIKQAIKSF